jgi:hypothetical protein
VPRKYVRKTGGPKRGQFSAVEEQLMTELIKQGMDLEAIAKKLNRLPNQVRSYAARYHGIGADPEATPKPTEFAEHVRKFRKSIYYPSLNEHYSKEELFYYENIYAGLMTHFHDDVTEVDELQVLQAIDAHMQINTLKKRTRNLNERILEIDRQIGELRIQDEEMNKEKILTLESSKQFYSQQIGLSTKTFTDLSKKFDETVQKLKSTRDQRLKTAENSAQSWTSLIKHMQDQKVREREGKLAAMVKFATDKKEKELQQPYRYMNDEIDQPMLVPEHVNVLADIGIEEEPHSG